MKTVRGRRANGVLAIVVMSKYPAAGRVKTRLTPALTPQQAADVHAALLDHCTRRLAAICESIGARLHVCFDPPGAAEAFAALLPHVPRVQFFPQSGGDLGNRLASAAGELCRQPDGSGALFFGVDSPDVPTASIHSAAALCRQADVVVGPTDDGGYWCVGVSARVSVRRLFEGIDWSSGRERAQTVERAGRLGYTVALADDWDDVDRPQDLQRLVRRLSSSRDADDRRLLEALNAILAGENHP